MNIIHENENMVAKFDTTSAILICSCKENGGDINMDALLAILHVWFEKCVEHTQDFSMILDLEHVQGDILGACTKIAAYFSQLDEKYIAHFKALAVITGNCSYYIDTLQALYTSSVPFKKVQDVEKGTQWINDICSSTKYYSV